MAFGDMEKDVLGSEKVYSGHTNTLTCNAGANIVEEITIPSAGWWLIEFCLYLGTVSGSNDALYGWVKTPGYTDNERPNAAFMGNAWVHMIAGSATRIYYIPNAGQKVQIQASSNSQSYNAVSRYILATKVSD